MSRPDSICRHFESFVTEELLERRVDVDGVAFEERDAIAGVEDRRVEAEAAAIEEVSPVDRADVDERCVRAAGKFSNLPDTVAFNSQRFSDVVTRTSRDDCERAI